MRAQACAFPHPHAFHSRHAPRHVGAHPLGLAASAAIAFAMVGTVVAMLGWLIASL
jgi:hypothetical protein